jgi:hypothetical protein
MSHPSENCSSPLMTYLLSLSLRMFLVCQSSPSFNVSEPHILLQSWCPLCVVTLLLSLLLLSPSSLLGQVVTVTRSIRSLLFVSFESLDSTALRLVACDLRL